ncbi:DUF2314 domain-containing protein [Mesorhizobium caraganae]|uniref:DUF2314 domain-containing protein n=1 Tax=Mesorhizobium caraganae TaxID=483206 RepID=A0ABV1Z2V9_9HYPH
MRNPIVVIAVAAAVGYGFFNSLGLRPGSGEPLAESKQNVVSYSTEDKAMQAAKNSGRSTLKRFHELMDAGTPGTYTVQFPLTQNGATEHIWLQLVGYSDGSYIGLLADVPVNGNKYKMGDRMTVTEADVEDWMIKNGKVIYGGYTTRQALADMPKEQVAKYGFTFRD